MGWSYAELFTTFAKYYEGAGDRVPTVRMLYIPVRSAQAPDAGLRLRKFSLMDGV